MSAAFRRKGERTSVFSSEDAEDLGGFRSHLLILIAKKLLEYWHMAIVDVGRAESMRARVPASILAIDRSSSWCATPSDWRPLVPTCDLFPIQTNL